METLLRAEHVNVGYPEKTVVEDVNIDAIKGKIICILGPNGAGKSTILKTITGSLAPVGGCIYIKGKLAENVSPKEQALMMSVVLTDKINMPMTTVRSIVAMGRIPHTNFFGGLTDEDEKIVDESIAAVNMEHLSHRLFNSLSDGEKQKVMIARALAQQPEVIVLDEPTSYLDIKNKIEIIKILDRMSKEKGVSIVMSLHDIGIAVKACEYLIMVNKGKIVKQGAPEEIIEKDTISKLYGVEGANYDAVLGMLEMNVEGTPQVALMCGNGSGIPFFRILARKNIPFVAGILFENDIDSHIAKSVTKNVISTSPFSPVTEKTVQEMRDALSNVECVIDCGFTTGKYNEVNIKLICEYLANGGKVFTARSEGECHLLFGTSSNITILKNKIELLRKAGDLTDAIR